MENYEVITKIGSGACGAVYLVRSHSNGRQYALKKVQLDDQKRTRTRQALLREAGILAKLKHPHIVVYHDSFFDTNTDQLHFMHIVQDYCDGGTMDDKIIEMKKKQNYFEESTIMEWFIQIAMAVQYIHSNKILHRDLKAQNVFMTKSDGVKLGDFGIAKVLDSTMDAAITCVGTPCNLSPEMCQDIPYSSKSDIWALGCLLFELCALQPAFDAKNLLSLFYKITQADYSPIPSHYSPPLSELIAAILIKDPEKRPSASAILNMPAVRGYLEVFIQDREYLLKQKIITLKAKMSGDSGANSPVQHRKRSSQQLGASATLRRSTPAHPTALSLQPNAQLLRKSLPYLTDSCSGDNSCEQGNSTDAQVDQSVKDNQKRVSVNYSDDFDSSSGSSEASQVVSDEEIPEELPEVADRQTIVKEEHPVHCGCSPSADLEAAESSNVYCYDDDFEDDSETEELDEIISKAKEAQMLKPQNEYFVDENDSPLNSKQSLRQYLEQLGDVSAGHKT
ncbi:uncharacterized protein [Watersipora subatra]|uniref:uncharacterized protein n=1 Tax=Watersipora subatra TaxID=2589382 RepID=UPI00355B8298